MYRYLPWLVLAVGVTLIATVFEPMFATRAVKSGPQGFAGQAAPVFALQDDRGSTVSLDAYRHRIVVMNLWASWCPPCREEMPDLQRLAERYGARGVAVVGVNEGESVERARAFAASLRIRFPIWIDSAERYGRVYGALGLPTTVILNGEGVVIRGFDGPLTFDQMEAAASSALHGS